MSVYYTCLRVQFVLSALFWLDMEKDRFSLAVDRAGFIFMTQRVHDNNHLKSTKADINNGEL